MKHDGANGQFTRRSALMSGFAGAVFLAGGHVTAQAQDVAAAELTASQLEAKLAQKDFFLVNVHIPYEGEIEKTDAFIPYDTISDSLDKLPQDKTAKIVVYCRGGGMSATAAKDLVRLGFTQVSDLMGGMNDWEKSGYKIIEK